MKTAVNGSIDLVLEGIVHLIGRIFKGAVAKEKVSHSSFFALFLI
jgi:hypothetical protein